MGGAELQLSAQALGDERSLTPFLLRAVRDGHAQVVRDRDRTKVIYHPQRAERAYDYPEEKVRAEFWAELIYVYGYTPARLGVEWPIPDRLPGDRADIVIFHDDDKKRPYAVIECKSDDITDAEFTQAIEQACGNGTWAKFRADYVGVVAGMTRRFLDFTGRYGVLEREANIIADLPRRYGRPEEYRFYKGIEGKDIRPIDLGSLITVIRKCHQTLWGGGKLSPPAAFSELCKIIFVKISDELWPRKDGEPYEFQIKTRESSHRLADRIRSVYESERIKNPDIFIEDLKIDDGALRAVVSHLESVDLTHTTLDVKGVAFEQFLDGFFKGNFGQYFTPRQLIEFMIEMLPPQHDDLVLDPACGSGGFLLYALYHIKKSASLYHKPESVDHYRYWEAFASDKLFGMEINDEIARVAKMNMIIHGDGHANMVCTDALARESRIQQLTGHSGFRFNRFDLILTNPPFGAQVNAADRPYLADYAMGNATDSRGATRPRKGQKTEILFIALWPGFVAVRRLPGYEGAAHPSRWPIG